MSNLLCLKTSPSLPALDSNFPRVSHPNLNMSKYTIKAGDTFFAIAKQLGISVNALQAANPGINASNLQIGQVINLPGSTNQSAISPDQTAALAVNNSARAGKGLNGLQWDKDLARAATEYAQHLAQLGKMQHASGTGQGENLFWMSPANDTAHASAAQAWINEASKYHGEQIPQGNFSAYGHYGEFHVWTIESMIVSNGAKSPVYVEKHHACWNGEGNRLEWWRLCGRSLYPGREYGRTKAVLGGRARKGLLIRGEWFILFVGMSRENIEGFLDLQMCRRPEDRFESAPHQASA
jgi:LysM repeat protein